MGDLRTDLVLAALFVLQRLSDQWVGSFDLRTWDKVYQDTCDRDCRHAGAFASIAAKDRFIVLESRNTDVPLWPIARKDIDSFRGFLERLRGYYKDKLWLWACSHFPKDDVDKYVLERIRRADEQSLLQTKKIQLQCGIRDS